MTLAGLTIASGSGWLTVNFLLLAWYYTRSAKVEEDALALELPEYVEYLSRTGRFLLPMR